MRERMSVVIKRPGGAAGPGTSCPPTQPPVIHFAPIADQTGDLDYVIEARITHLARAIGIVNPGFDSFLGWVLELRETLTIMPDLAALGIDDSQAERIGRMAKADPSSGTNPLQFTANEYQALFLRALSGDLESAG